MSASQPHGTRHKVALMPSGHQGTVSHGTTVLEAAQALGVEIESICGGRQTCGKCLVEPVKGDFQKLGIRSTEDHLSPPDPVEVAYAEEHGLDLTQRRLGCAARVIGDTLISIPAESLARKQVIRKEAGNLKLTVAPAVQLAYAEVAAGHLGGPSDWQRTRQALQEQCGLEGLAIDPRALADLSAALERGSGALTATVWGEREVIRVEPGYNDRLYGLAIDIGSTTVACYLCNLRTGALVATVADMNPQIRYGEDLMSRISYAMSQPSAVERLHRAITATINQLASTAAELVGIRAGEITDVVLVGNSVMHHLVLGLDPTSLGHSPFVLTLAGSMDLKARDLRLTNLHQGAMVHILPCIAGHVGADNVGVLLAQGDFPEGCVSLIVDIGTNAEILLGARGRVLSASTPTGPALEGAQITHGQRAAPGAIERVRIDPDSGGIQYRVVGDPRWSGDLAPGESLRPTGICGSGVVEAVAGLFLAGFIDETGFFQEGARDRSDRLRFRGRVGELVLVPSEESATGEAIVFTQADVRAIQLAKAALYAGIRILMDRMGVGQVDRIKLAGAFGNHIDPTFAMILGMIPDCDLGQVQGVGHAAGDGARMALLNRRQRHRAQQAAAEVEHVELAVEPTFQTYFVEAMNLPHACHPFPHLEGRLPIRPPSPRRRRRSVRHLSTGDTSLDKRA